MSRLTISFESAWLDDRRSSGVRVVRQLEKWISRDDAVKLVSSSATSLTVEMKPAHRAEFAEALGRDFKECAVFDRHAVRAERDAKAIGFSAIRGGDIVGDHTVMFAGTGERIEISHKSGSRAGYAQGSLRAARFLAQRANGLFDMLDVLGLK